MIPPSRPMPARVPPRPRSAPGALLRPQWTESAQIEVGARALVDVGDHKPRDAEPPITGTLGLMKLTATVLDSPDPRALATFYHQLLDGWTLNDAEDEWVTLRMPDGRPGLSFQYEAKYARPTWPAGPGDQQMQMHLDIEVDDLEAAVARAVELGATVEEYQPQKDVRVMRDPDGHVFDLWVAT